MRAIPVGSAGNKMQFRLLKNLHSGMGNMNVDFWANWTYNIAECGDSGE